MRLSAVLFLAACLVRPLAAQDVERPVAFDTAARIMTITPPLATRLGLTAPVWPVSGGYVEARLLARGNDTFVISVQRNDGTVARFPFSAQQRVELARLITAANDRMSTSERLDISSAPAGGQFIRNQTVAGLVLYGPGVASLSENGSTSTALYLLTAGATFFAASTIARSGNITRAQNLLATDGTWRGALIANGLRYVLNAETSSRTTAAITVGGALVGSTLSFQFGRHLTDGEAHGATFGSTVTTALTAGAIGIGGGFEGDNQRPEVAGLVAGSLIGYPIGLRYVRRAPYSITAGDFAGLETAGLVGILGSSVVIADDNVSGSVAAGVLTAGLIGGLALGDRILVKPYNFTESQGWLLRLGTLAGGLIALALPVGMEADDARAYLAAATAGAAIGMGVTTRILSPDRQR
jgi:hypothetical protein